MESGMHPVNNKPLYVHTRLYIFKCNSRDRVVQLYPPVSPYIKKSFEGILMYGIAGGFINKYFNYADLVIVPNLSTLYVELDNERDV